MEKIINNKIEMDGVAAAILEQMLRETKDAHATHATVLGLSGELGAGKTAFTQSFARALGIRESVPSPTFVIARFYDIPNTAQFRRLVHVDAYRIGSEDELGPIGWSALLAEPTNLLLVEWPEMIGKSFPSYGAILFFQVISETVRRIYDKKGNI
ncbi:MAG: tRNA (adenosine(37)-N6)-threonylcarbamoyltransferase complex ATPase subunit type 1 TsaE [Candidatus Lloydbacteria bacterium RIFCSPHIGHO2_01_FULL_49_22]|uniref:tRNA threonylcarbamoyladenosine biosynthesis protein TsaE n=1 Tax=Candidatus Lloydbacteria bacterium RIFCSPHIGHO2_01_FULL_49_22 TaxID=1798658 RepID=A0A1G2CY85_9BACT|nr:MAG: tRNA (adenosine(37)-N6)-threonylcarbamoyltransferase complex ATPase subunit type 1 TsaE [Candidatus Lloydbacteria bacterium RIFCSPHIGHO2_01_FULL_49_22]OGZ09822.1 MAG: tRNA (adenosine(37)-N6)-threonylcarbamoyltransferase complex ATPase subunit type 1 TsaE [Candidatus Lloydbacteria bacterium RIFCSPHIGHO2_02_FULL_50_18]